MAKKKNKNKRTESILLLCFSVAIAVAIVLILCAAIGKFLKSGGSFAEQTETDPSAEEAEEEEVQGIVFPYELDGGKLILNSVFQSSIDNPDNDDNYSDDIASLEVENVSSEFCESLQIVVTMPDGRRLNFEGTDIPSGKKAWLFEKSNQSMELQEPCIAIEDKAVFEENSLMEDKLQISIEETNLIIQNTSTEEVSNIKIGCHCRMDDTYYGGITYYYPVDYIGVGETVTLDAAECYLGVPDVVSIQVSQ